MIKTRFDRADGRYVYWYAFDGPSPPILQVIEQERGRDQIELRWNALLGEHVIISTGRQGRTYLPPAEYCPLCPTSADGAFATEIPSFDYEVAVFENRFPSFRPDAPDVPNDGPLASRAPATGICEVVVYTPRHDASFTSMSLREVEHLVDVWADRYAALVGLPGVRYVFIFENRGKEIGVTLTHPHGQIYAFPFVPPVIERERAAARQYSADGSRCLICDVVETEQSSGTRVVASSAGFVAYVPFAARMPYEIHIAATAHRESLLDLDVGERAGLAEMLGTVQTAYDSLWGFAMPYTMSMHQRVVDAGPDPFGHLHIEFLPPYRTKDKLKYLAGVETGAGTFINDTAPEETARDLREALKRT